MGSKISSVLAILVMDHLERSTLFAKTLSYPVIFLRYVDDCICVFDRNANCDNLLSQLNRLHPSIQFELQMPRQDGFLPVLDTVIYISSTGQLQHKFHVKKANRGIFIHADSALPDSIKRNAINEEVHRATFLSSDNPSRQQALQHMFTKFQANGYPWEKIKNFTKRPTQLRPQHRSSHSCVSKVPFNSNKFNGQLKR